MASTNAKSRKSHVYDYEAPKLAGGMGNIPAKQNAEALLRRCVMGCLLWEDIAYNSGNEIVKEIQKLVPQVDPEVCKGIAIEARYNQKLRHVPLLIVREMARHKSHSHLVRETLRAVINRPDEIPEFISIYWKTNDKKSLPKQVKLGISDAFNKFDSYQLAKWNRGGKEVSLRDAMFLCHAKPSDNVHVELFKQLAENSLPTPDTWEVGLSAAKTNQDKVDVWVSLIDSNKLGALALLKNIRGMDQCGVPSKKIRQALKNANPQMLLPIDFIRAADNAAKYVSDIEDLMYRCLDKYPKLTGTTVFVLDVSGSMGTRLSAKTQYNRMDAGIAMTILAREMCEHCSIYLTAGSDYARKHKTKLISGYRGFGLASHIRSQINVMGGGGIFTRQCLEHINKLESETPDRIIVFSDSQDCDIVKTKPEPFGKTNYIVDVSCHKHGVNYDGVWTSEISGWSEHFLRYIHALENFNN